MTDEERLYKLDNGSDTARWAAEEIRRLRGERNDYKELYRGEQKAVAALEQELSELRAFKERPESQTPVAWASVSRVERVVEFWRERVSSSKEDPITKAFNSAIDAGVGYIRVEFVPNDEIMLSAAPEAE